ncbi:MAG: citrate lyase subunit beta / citryl-CoA lyase [Bacteroidota bacterium]|nr:citrate lyase subunit beta / citryl-CoA lyase [Bacteroidota bacterium]
MNKNIATTGNAGPKVRSDCEVTLELKTGGGLVIDLTSKVKVLYGESIKSLCLDVLKFFKIRNAAVRINDSGALPFVIAARVEAAIHKLVESDSEFLPEMLRENRYSTEAGRQRFSRLYLPGNTPGMMINAGLHSADGIILDLEDSVTPEKKDEARILVRNALRQIDFRGAERMVRINQGEPGLKDLHYLIPQNVNLILVPKCENRNQIIIVDKEIDGICKKLRIKNTVFLMPIIESALGVENSFEIARASDHIVAIAIGLEDLTADLGVSRTTEGKESLYARTRLIIAAKAAGIQPIDSVFSDVDDMDTLRQNILTSKALGFEGMGCIHPRQIAVINKGFAPDESEIEKSKKIVIAYEEARKQGLGVAVIGSKMIDPPVVARAQKTINLAVRLGKLEHNWIKEASSDGN